MAKHNQKSNKEVKKEEVNQMEKTAVQETAQEVETETKVEVKEPQKASKKEKKQKQVKANKEPKKSKIKEVFAELKKVSWPSFGKTMKQTGMVLSIVTIFGLVVLGFDVLISKLLELISRI